MDATGAGAGQAMRLFGNIAVLYPVGQPLVPSFPYPRLLVLFALTAINLILVFYFHTLFPLLVDLHKFPGLLNFMVSTWIAFSLEFNYIMCLCTKPGSPSEHGPTSWSPERPAGSKVVQSGPWGKHCKKCNAPKPARAHHCALCGRCVLKMDHHCPWVNGCVGHHNHRYFFLFTFYLWVACWYLTPPPFWLQMFGPRYVICMIVNYQVSYGFLLLEADAANATSEVMITVSGIACLMVFAAFSAPSVTPGPLLACPLPACLSPVPLFLVPLALQVGISLTFFVAWNSYLAFSAQTTIEWHYNRRAIAMAKKQGSQWRNPYDLGLRRNLAMIFGPYRYLPEVLVPSLAPLQADGMGWDQ
eukprot:gene5803-1034_t